MKHVMHDIETLGTRPTSAILSIGAVAFTKNGIEDRIYLTIKPESCAEVGLTTDQDTLDWWAKQSGKAKEVFENPEHDLVTALTIYAQWIRKNAITGSIFGNGSDFDNVIIANAYRAIGYQTPWKFWKSGCYRTIKNMYPGVQMLKANDHNALADAENQTEHFIRIINQYGLPL